MSELMNAIALPIIFFLPGYLTFHVFAENKQDLSLVETVFLHILGSVLFSGWVALALAELGCFSLQLLSIILLVSTCLLALKYRRTIRLRLPMRSKASSTDFLAVTILIVCLLLFFRPFEWILGGGDPGVYVNTGVNIAKTGNIVIESAQTLLDVPMDLASNFYETFMGSQPYPGFLFDRSSGRIIPQFFHLFPTWIAIFYSLFGVEWFLYVTPLFGALGVLSVFLLGKTIFDDQAAVIASAFLALSLPQVWYSRYPTTEVMTQFLVFSALLTFYKFRQTLIPYYAVLSGVSFGQVLLTRIDGVTVLFPLFVYLLFIWASGRGLREHFWLAIPLIGTCVHALAHAILISGWYTFDSFAWVFETSKFQSVQTFSMHQIIALLSLIALLIAAGVVQGWFGTLKPIVEKLLKHTSLFRIVFSLSVLAYFAYQYFLRPLGFDYSKISSLSMESLISLTWHGSDPLIPLNMVRLGWYVSPFCLALGVTGIILCAEANREKTIFLGLLMPTLLINLENARIIPVLNWWVRRYVPVVVPFLLLCSGYALTSSWRARWKRKSSRILSKLLVLMLTCGVLINFACILVPAVRYVEYEGLTRLAGQFSRNYTEKDIVIFDGVGPENALSTPLTFMFGKNALSLRHVDPRLKQRLDYDLLNRVVETWILSGRSVYVVNPEQETSYSLDFAFQFAFQEMLSVPLMEETLMTIPSTVRLVNSSIVVYRLTSQARMMPGQKLFIDIGYNDTGFVKGFHQPETTESMTYRWTKREASVKIPFSVKRSSLLVEIKLSKWRPSTVSPPRVSIGFNDKEVEYAFDEASAICSFVIHPEAIRYDFQEIKIVSDTFIPRLCTNSTDDRELGVILDWVRITVLTADGDTPIETFNCRSAFAPSLPLDLLPLPERPRWQTKA